MIDNVRNFEKVLVNVLEVVLDYLVVGLDFMKIIIFI